MRCAEKLGGRAVQGFTLIEVLIAMTLLGVMVVLLFSSLRIAAESWEAGETKTAQVNQKAVVYQFFKRHLNAIRPLPMLENNAVDLENESLQAFAGYSQSLRFAGALPASSARKGVQIFRIYPDPNQTSTLLVSLMPYRQTEGQLVEEPPVVLLEGMTALKFSYFGKTEEAAEDLWLDEWIQADRLPRLIKVSIKLNDNSLWPDMVFAPRITQAASVETALDEENAIESDAEIQSSQ